MRIGACLSLSRLPLPKGALDYVELNLSRVAELSPAELTEWQAKLREAGVTAESANGFFPAELRLVGPERDATAIRAYVRRAFDNAAALGIRLCVLGSGKARRAGPELSPKTALPQFEETVAWVGDLAEAYDMTVAVEPLCAAETDLVNTVAEGAALCRRLAHPRVRLLADLFHVTAAGEPLSVLTDNRDLLCHIHAAAPATRALPQPDDGYDYAAFFGALRSAGYDGRVSIEVELPRENAAAALTDSLHFLRRIAAG